MITFLEKGNIFEDCKAVEYPIICNPINAFAISGKGLALEFKKRFLENKAFLETAKRLEILEPGVNCKTTDGNTIIINCVTKKHYKNNSRIEWIESCYEDISRFLSWNKDTRRNSIWIPALGCGLGGLEWKDVQPLVEKHLGGLKEWNIYQYLPQ